MLSCTVLQSQDFPALYSSVAMQSVRVACQGTMLQHSTGLLHTTVLHCTVPGIVVCASVTAQVASRDRIAIGGHSYGAFMAANLLAHAPGLFCCAIAQSGAYNRTLTPFSFQVHPWRTLGHPWCNLGPPSVHPWCTTRNTRLPWLVLTSTAPLPPSLAGRTAARSRPSASRYTPGAPLVHATVVVPDVVCVAVPLLPHVDALLLFPVGIEFMYCVPSYRWCSKRTAPCGRRGMCT